MNIKQTNLNDIIHYEQNNKEHDDKQIEMIANSIKEYGFVQPIVVDSNNVIIIGHGRALAAKKLGLEKVPTIQITNLTETQVRKLRILDNKLNESDWDLVNLKLELDDLGDMNFGDLEFNIGELFPEFDAPSFNPEEYEENENKEDDKKVCVKVFVKDKDTAALLVADLESMGYSDVKL